MRLPPSATCTAPLFPHTTLFRSWVAVSAIAWGCFSVVQRFRPGAMPPVTRFAAVMLFGILALLPFHIAEAAAGALPRLDLQTAGTVLVVALIPGLGAYMGYARIQRALGAGPASLFLYIQPVYVAVMAWLLLGERSEEDTSELQSLMRLSYAVLWLKQKTQNNTTKRHHRRP